MKIKFNLNSFTIDTTQREFTDKNGKILLTSTLESMLSLITIKYYYCKNFETVRIHSDLFRKLSGSYRQYLNYLRDKGLIVIDELYKRGKKSKGYMFTDNFKAFAEIKEVYLDKTYRDKEKAIKIHLEIDPIVKARITKDFNSLAIKQIPVEKKIRFFNQDGVPIVNFRSYISDVVNLYRLQTNAYNFRLKAGRFYTPFSQLSQTVRENHIYFDEQKLANLDIRNSFPMWLAIWLIDKGIEIDYDTQEFFNEILSGQFYNELIYKYNKAKDLFNTTGMEKPCFTKDMVKQNFMTWLNGNNKRNNLTNYVFHAYYPSMFEFLNQYKAGKKDTMYYELVKMETEFIFNVICKQLYDSILEIKILTCHDQIYFESKFIAKVLPIWDEEINKIRALIPTVPEYEFSDADLEEMGIYFDCA
jgi:hypothetical protein